MNSLAAPPIPLKTLLNLLGGWLWGWFGVFTVIFLPPGNTFAPDDTLTRVEAAVLCNTILKYFEEGNAWKN